MLEHVFDPDVDRVRVLRQFGINAFLAQASTHAERPPRPHQGNLDRLRDETRSGLHSLSALGTTLCLGDAGPALTRKLQPPLLGIPGFHALPIDDSQTGHLIAQWLQGCLNHGLEIVDLNRPERSEQHQGWRALLQPRHQEQSPILILNQPIGADELLEELHWYRQGCPMPEPCLTPDPGITMLFDQGDAHRGKGLSVCISLHNYETRILNALNSVLAQTNAPCLELIVVDDASSDNGAALVQSWMKEHHQQMGRCLLLKHTTNGGLAAARNTAFRMATNTWCFVLDADNQLDPQALEHCGQLLATATNAAR